MADIAVFKKVVTGYNSKFKKNIEPIFTKGSRARTFFPSRAAMDAQDTESLLGQVTLLASGRSRSVLSDLFDANEVVTPSTLHAYAVGAYETMTQDLDSLSQAGTVESWDDEYDLD